MTRVLKQGEYTSTVYKLIADGDYKEAANILETEMKRSGQESRAALSLIATCKYHMAAVPEQFESAAGLYYRLIQLCPDNDDYKFDLAMCLYKACKYDEAMKASFSVQSSKFAGRVQQLQAAIKYMEDDLPAAKSLIEKQGEDSCEAVVNQGCILYKEGYYSEAIAKFQQAIQLEGVKAHLSYNIALCYFNMKQYSHALKNIAEIIERGIKDHPELSVGLATEGIDVRSVGNTAILHETSLVEAFNLKAAVEYNMGPANIDTAAEALTDMPPRAEEELDPVTLHNSALINMEEDPSEGFEKLQHLLASGVAPPMTFANLIVLYLKFGYFSLAADTLAENPDLVNKFMDRFQQEFVQAVIMVEQSPDEAYKRLEQMASRQTDNLRKYLKTIQEAQKSDDKHALKKAVHAYDEELDRFIPVLMQQAKIYWDKENYDQVEKIFRKSVEFGNENDTWKLNVAHVLFMQENGQNSSPHKYKEAAGFYEPIVKKENQSILNVEAVVLANLCVSYIMTSQNEEAEELMRQIEKEEEQLAYEFPEKKVYHLCIVNLVIGTLYCSKGNYEFGIARVIKSLEPFQKKLGTDTWFYVKRCFLSLLEAMSKQLALLPDNILFEALDFLEICEQFGREIKARDVDPLSTEARDARNTVAFESRQLKCQLLRLMGWP